MKGKTRIAKAAEEMLTGSLLPFWQSLRDERHGGFYGGMDFSLQIDQRAEKGSILASRILWFFSTAARALGDRALVPYACHAYAFLRDACIDREQGGVFRSVTFDGKPADTGKHTDCQAFALYALSAYYRLSGESEALALMKNLFSLMEERCRDGEGYSEAFARDFSPAENGKLWESGVPAGRTMNTLLHVLEGYAGFYEVAKSPRAAAAMERILYLYREKVYDPERRRQQVLFDRDYRPLLDLTSYGHDIEASWLTDWACGLLDNAILKAQTSALNSALAAQVLGEAYDGALANGREGDRMDCRRIWWVQAEGVLGFVNAWEKHPGSAAYREAVAGLWRYITRHLVDSRPGGEWFWQVSPQGVPDEGKPIVSPWKCPYHNGRMCLELMRRDPGIFV